MEFFNTVKAMSCLFFSSLQTSCLARQRQVRRSASTTLGSWTSKRPKQSAWQWVHTCPPSQISELPTMHSVTWHEYALALQVRRELNGTCQMLIQFSLSLLDEPAARPRNQPTVLHGRRLQRPCLAHSRWGQELPAQLWLQIHWQRDRQQLLRVLGPRLQRPQDDQSRLHGNRADILREDHWQDSYRSEMLPYSMAINYLLYRATCKCIS